MHMVHANAESRNMKSIALTAAAASIMAGGNVQWAAEFIFLHILT
jgi:hypothetical protein